MQRGACVNRRQLNSLFWGDKMNEDLKRNIRESLVYALHSTVPSKGEMSKTLKRLVISEFFHSLNRKMVLFNCEVEGEISQANVQLDGLETKI